MGPIHVQASVSRSSRKAVVRCGASMLALGQLLGVFGVAAHGATPSQVAEIVSLTAPAVGQAAAGLVPASAQEGAVGGSTSSADIVEESGGADGAISDGVITVTASRVSNAAFNAPTATQVLNAEALTTRSADNIGVTLQQLPVFRASVGPQSNGVRTISPGATFSDMRGLGSSRTLVLVDGNRYVPQIYTGLFGYQVDMAQVPQLLVERVEVVTGGASAQWGSDAVAGVVNVILKKDFEGFSFDAQAGVSDRGDNESYRIAAMAGTNFADGRGNVVLAFDQWENDGVGDPYTRSWGREGWTIVGNPDPVGNGLPRNIIAPDTRYSAMSPGGLLINTSLRGTTFDSSGQPIPFIYGELAGAGTNGVMIGGGSNKGLNIYTGLTIRPAGERRSFYGRTSFEISPAFVPYIEASSVFTYGTNMSLPARDASIPIYRDNPYLPDELRQRMIDENIQSVNMGRVHFDLGQQVSDTRNRTRRVAVGFDGNLSDNWRWNGAFIYGKNRYRQLVFDVRHRANFALAQDPVRDPNTGRIVCRSTLANPNNGCVPLNLFGPNSISAEAREYVTGTIDTTTVYEQTAANLNLSGELFSTWAGPVSVALGAEYRDEKQATDVDPVAAVAGWEAGNATPLHGSFNVKEAYLETAIPLAKDASFARSLDLNGAIRVAEYSTSAGTQVTWKVGATWEPTDFLLFRVARSRDIRAPNIAEMNAPNQVTRVNVLFNGINSQVTQYTGGNPDLQPEKADTLTAGVVLRPDFAPGLNISLDYYNIKVHGEISTISTTQLFDRCERGLEFFCQAITFDSAGVPIEVVNPYLNLNLLRREGLDGVIAYHQPVDGLFSGTPASVGVSLNAHYALKYGTDVGDPVIGYDDAVREALPRFSATANVNLDVGRLGLNTQIRYIGPMVFNLDYVEGVHINKNDIPSVTYVDMSASYQINDQIEIFGNVDNLFDKNPPIVPATFGYPTNATFFDMIGRTYRIGVRGRF